MSDLIDRQTALEALNKLCVCECEYSKKQRSIMCGACHLGSAIEVIEMLPSTQTEIIYCKDCKWYGSSGCAIRIVDDTDRPKENDFCSFAERKDDEE